jgi:hypothetical protein
MQPDSVDELNTSDIPFFNKDDTENEEDEEADGDGATDARPTLTVKDLVIDEELRDVERICQLARSSIALQVITKVIIILCHKRCKGGDRSCQ